MFDDARRRAQTAPRECAHTCFELLQRERFGHVVIGTEVQPLHALLDAVGCGEDEHRHAGATRAQLAQHIKAVHAWQTQVQDHQVKFVRRKRRISFTAAADLIHGITRCAQGPQQTIGQNLVVFGNQDSHALSPAQVV